MEFIEVTLLNGNKVSIRRDLVLYVMKLEHVSKELLKEKPFLKDVEVCTMIQLSVAPGEIYCGDSYDSVMQKLRSQ